MNLTHIDWLGARTQSEPMECLEALRGGFGSLGGSLKAVPRKHGKQGFERSDSLFLADLSVGTLSFGGEAMRGWVWLELTGVGCQWVDNWDRCQDDLFSLRDFQYKRVDIALDTHKREVTHETVIEAHNAGLFTTCRRPPSMSQIIPADPYEGRTINIGKRDQPKFLRAYEKGFEQARKFPKMRITHFDGVPIEDWYRLEVELKAKHQPLPEDLIENRDQYFSGAYPYLQSVLDVEPQVLKMSRDRSPQRSLESMLEIIRQQYGTSLFTALVAHHGDIGAVWEKIVGSHHNQRLVEDGVLMVDHI